MSKRRRRKLIIEDPSALASPVRMEVMEQFEAIGPASVRDVASRMGRTSHALHYHVRQLVEAGFVERTGTRKSGPRDEAVYDITADRFEIAVEAGRPASSSATVRVVRAALRRAERDYAALADTFPERLVDDDVYAGRLRTKVSRAGLKEIARHVRGIEEVFAREMRREHPPQTRLETCTLTVVMLPDLHAS